MFFGAARLACVVLGVLGELVVPAARPTFATFPIQLAAAPEETASVAAAPAAPPGDAAPPGGEEAVPRAERVRIQMDGAEALFGPFGVQFEPTPRRVILPPHFAHIETRADRDALAAHVTPHVINVFLV